MARSTRWGNILTVRRSCSDRSRSHVFAMKFRNEFSSFKTYSTWALVALLSLGAVLSGTAADTKVSRSKHKKSAVVRPPPKSATTPTATGPLTSSQKLEVLSHQLDPKRKTSAYDQLATFANAQGDSPLAARAALALGYNDYRQQRFVDGRKWLVKAAADPVLADYALYWTALTDRATALNEEALTELKQYRRKYPDGVMAESAVEELARAALSLDKPQEAVAALDAYEKTANVGKLLLLRAQAREQVAATNGQPPLAAATDYLDVYYRFPLSAEASAAGMRIPALRALLGEQFPGTPLTLQIARAEAFYQSNRWSDLGTSYRDLLPSLLGQARERALLRIARANAALGAGRTELASLQLSDPDLDSERLYLLSQEYRTANQEDQMLALVDEVAQKYPQSLSTADALFAAGNYFWLKLDRPHAADYYSRAVAAAPAGPNAATAQWRVIWTKYLARQDVRDQIEQYLRQYPNSSYFVDALYFMGRAQERAGNVPHARSFYVAAAERFPETYFGGYAYDRLKQIGREPINPADFLALVPAVPPLPPFTKSIPVSVNDRWARAQALRSVAFDASAELELRIAYDQIPAPGLLLAVADAAAAAGRYPQSIIAARQLVPRLESRKFDDVAVDLWRAVYPWPYRAQIQREAERNNLDPAVLAGLIRQESAFASDALSGSNAIGLTQVWPPTGAKLARLLKVSYSNTRLFDPDYNLRLGSYYLANLFSMFGKPEYAVAAYNAGENRVVQWTADQNYEEMPEFVESIPITQTREYVQIVLRNAGLYRRIYSVPGNGSITASADSKRQSQ
jgi:soluble lytic murein transglycosylase